MWSPILRNLLHWLRATVPPLRDWSLSATRLRSSLTRRQHVVERLSPQQSVNQPYQLARRQDQRPLVGLRSHLGQLAGVVSRIFRTVPPHTVRGTDQVGIYPLIEGWATGPSMGFVYEDETYAR